MSDMILLKDKRVHRIKTVILIFLLTVFPLTGLFSYNWPVDEPVITSTFGEDKWGSFGRGIEIFGNAIEVSPSDDGQIIFYHDNSVSAGAIPSGVGSFAVVEHERKLRTLYGSIDFEPGIENKQIITTSESLGRAGNTGKSAKPHIFFAVIDSEFEQYVNPLLLLNSIIDSKPPVIRETGIKTPAGYQMVNRSAVVKAGRAEIYAEIFDPCMSEDFFCPMAPYKIYLFLNGEEIFYLSFESLITEDGRPVIQSNTGLEYSDYYKEDGKLSLGNINLVPGESRFEILVCDYAGNEASRSFKLRVVE